MSQIIRKSEIKNYAALTLAFAVAMTGMCVRAQSSQNPPAPQSGPFYTATFTTQNPSPSSEKIPLIPLASATSPSPPATSQTQTEMTAPLFTGVSPPAPPLAETAPPTFLNTLISDAHAEDIITFMMYGPEGGDVFVSDDNGHGPCKFGIDGYSNGLTFEQTRNLTAEQAFNIYKIKYWDETGVGNLPANMRLLAFNAYILFGPGESITQLIEEAHNDPHELLRLTAIHLQGKAHSWNVVNAWEDRQAQLGKIIDNDPQLPLLYASVMSAKHTSDINSPAYYQSDFNSFANDKTNYREDFPDFTPSQDPSTTGLLWLLAIIGLPFGIWLNRDKLDRSISLPVLGRKKSPPLKTGLPKVFSQLQSIRLPFLRQKTALTQRRPLPQSTLNLPKFIPLTQPQPQALLSFEEERAFDKVFAKRNPTLKVDKWHIDYSNQHPQHKVIVAKGALHVEGMSGFEDSIEYLYRAWGSRVVANFSSPEMAIKVRVAAQNLVDKGRIPSGFVIEGMAPIIRCSRDNIMNFPLRPANDEPGIRGPYKSPDQLQAA